MVTPKKTKQELAELDPGAPTKPHHRPEALTKPRRHRKHKSKRQRPDKRSRAALQKHDPNAAAIRAQANQTAAFINKASKLFKGALELGVMYGASSSSSSFSTNAEKDTEKAPTFHTPLKHVKEEAPDEDERHDTFAKDEPSSSENEHSSSSIGDDDILFQDLLVKQSAKCCANDIYERIKKRKHGSATWAVLRVSTQHLNSKWRFFCFFFAQVFVQEAPAT